MKKILLVLLVTIFLTLPVNSAGIKNTMTTILDSWLGENINTVINQWGYPNDERIIVGRKLYYWTNNQTIYTPATTNGTISTYGPTSYYNGSTYGGNYTNLYCTRILEVDSKDIVINWQYEGNNCPFALAGKYKNQWLNKTNYKK